MIRSIAELLARTLRHSPLALVVLAILLVGADPTPGFLGHAPPPERATPSPVDQPTAGFLLPVSVAAPASAQQDATKAHVVELMPATANVAQAALVPPPCSPLASVESRAERQLSGRSLRLRC